MIDLKKRLQRTFSIDAMYESLEDALDKDTITVMVRWGRVIAEQFVIKSSQMEEELADEFLAPYSSALRKMMRAMGHWAVEANQAVRLEWWNRIEQNGKTLYGDRFILPQMEVVLSRLPLGADTQSIIAFIQKLIEAQKAKS